MFKQRYWIPSHWHIYVLFAVVTIGFSALLLAANKVYSQSAMQNSKPIFVDEILPVPNPLPASPSDGFNLVGPSRDYLTLSGGSAATLSGIDAAAFSKLNIPNALSPVKFYYQRSIGEFADQEYIDGAFSEEHSARLAAAVGSMLGVLDSRMNELMTCAVPRTNSDVPQAYRANNSTTALDGDRLASDLRLMFFSPPKDVHIAIGAFGNSQRSDGSFISGVTWSQIPLWGSNPSNGLECDFTAEPGADRHQYQYQSSRLAISAEGYYGECCFP